ncbi:MAG TPA: hypothetical protein VLJ86_08395 [Ramlibacter sp.]|nr:hypothetical protein [Ramlibacter sp.]
MTLEELMSKPSNGAGWRLNNEPSEVNEDSPRDSKQAATYLRFHFNASSKALVGKGVLPFRAYLPLPKTDVRHCDTVGLIDAQVLLS